MNSCLHTRIMNFNIRFQSCTFDFLKISTNVILHCKVFATMRTLPREGTEYGYLISVATIHLLSQSIENFMSVSAGVIS